jgi:putative endonuclease
MDEAYWYEKQIQGWGRDKRVALIEGRLDLLQELAKSRQRFDDVIGTEREGPASDDPTADTG